MSEEEVQQVAEEVQPIVEEEEPLSFLQALVNCLQTSLIHDGLARGLRESVKALDRREAHLCILAESCDEAFYVKLITALCEEYQVKLIKVEDAKELGEWVGLGKVGADGVVRKVVGCSCVVIRAWGEESKARTVVLENLEQM